MESTENSSYDEILYKSWPFVQSHPDRLATVALVLGMDPPPTIGDEFRMLELGCSCGDNLIPLAMQHPRAQFVGIDFSQRQVDVARQVASQLGVANIQFERLDILNFPDSGEPFDFIAAHGVYSWVPPEVRDKLLAICRRRLKAHGVAYVSYNVYPGCRMRDIVREVLLYHLREWTDPQQRIQQAMAFLRFMADCVPHDDPAYKELYPGTLKSLGDDGAAQTRLFHDLLVTTNDPVYFHEFVEHAARHDLQFVGEADIQEMQIMRFPAEVISVLGKLGDDVIQREQYLDFIKHRQFRQTLLCHREASVKHKLQASALRRLRIAADIRCDSPEADPSTTDPLRFRRDREVEASIDDPLIKAALLHLIHDWPRSVAFDELEAAARRRLNRQPVIVQTAAAYAQGHQELLENLLHLYAAGLVQFHVHEPQLSTIVSDRPVASPWARWQAERGSRVTNLRHVGVMLSEIHRQLLLSLDGTRDREQLLDELTRQVQAEGLVVLREGQAVRGEREIRRTLDDTLDEDLRTAASLALLIA